MRKITVGASVDMGVTCFPLRECDNWRWGLPEGYRALCLGPLRLWLRVKRETANRD